MFKKTTLLTLLCFTFSFGKSQTTQLPTDWKSLWLSGANFYVVQQAFNDYWIQKLGPDYIQEMKNEKNKVNLFSKDDENELPGYELFKRWEYYMEPRVYPSGDVTLPSNNYEIFKTWLDQSGADRSTSGNWTLMGPPTVPSNGGGAGRLNFIRFTPGSTTDYWTGSPAGSLWHTTNAGTSYSTNTDLLSLIGCSDVAIDPLHTNTMYLATGDGDAGDTYSIGVLKSTDGGATWNTTGLTWAVSQGRTISRLLINPTHPDTVFAGTSIGIYRSMDAGATWTSVSGLSGIKDMEFKPNDASVVYACNSQLYKSTNYGGTFTHITSGLPATTGRMSIAVTPANASYVYIIAAKTDDSFQGLYRSTDIGVTFTTRSTSPNLLGWNSNGGDLGVGQGWYDLAIDASPTNVDQIFIGGINIWKSTNGGTSWTISNYWQSGGAHADIHCLTFMPGSATTCFAATDGGLYKTTNTGTSWSSLNANMTIAEIYGMGQSASNSTKVLGGLQDNGTIFRTGTAWSKVLGGDGMKCFVDRTNDVYEYGELYYGDFYRTSNTWGNNTGISPNTSETGAWVTPWIQGYDANGQTLYAGYSNVFKSTNRGSSWSAISAWSGTTTVVNMAACPTSTTTLYVIRGNVLYKTTNGGSAWTNITGSNFPSGASLTYVAVNPTNANKVWVTFSGYSSGNKVYYSSNGGTSWTNTSNGLPNLPTNCVVCGSGATEPVYVGMDVGVYYKDNTMSFWQPFMTGLPNVTVTELMIYSGVPAKLRASTFGRGFWESDLFTSTSGTPPTANFSGAGVSGCPTLTVTFTDLSSNSPTAYLWTFPGGNPATSTLQNPTVTYTTSGLYSVTLVCANAFGTDTITQNNFVNVWAKPVPAITKTNVLCYGDSTGSASVAVTGGTLPYTYSWSNGSGNVTSISGLPIGSYSVTVVDSNGCSGSTSFNIFQPTAIAVTTGSNADIGGAGGKMWVGSFGGTAPYYYLWNDATSSVNDTVYNVPAGTYIVTVTDAHGCVKYDTVVVQFVSSVDNSTFGELINIFPNPVKNKVYINSEILLNADVSLTDVLGRIVYQGKLNKQMNKEIDLSLLPAGNYMLNIVTEKNSLMKKIVKI